MYTANTMATAIEAMGMSLPYSASNPAVERVKIDECVEAGKAVRRLLELDLKPRDIMTRAAFENAMVMVSVLGDRRMPSCTSLPLHVPQKSNSPSMISRRLAIEFL